MKIIIAPDSFKGSLSGKEAAEAMLQAIRAVVPDATCIVLPISDGGEGAAHVLASALPGKFYQKQVCGPYEKPVQASYYLTESRLGIVELAEAAGLTLTTPGERNPLYATTFGVGELLLDAIANGATQLCLTLGGSATNDGGAGIAKALGIRLLNRDGKEVAPHCAGLEELAHIDAAGMRPEFREIPILIACDVKNPLCGPEGASHIYGPQKGADAHMVGQMDAILAHYETLLSDASGNQSLGALAGSGAAGGAALPLLAFCNAKIVSGIDLVLDTLEFERHLQDANLVLTGEGKIDGQTKYGKAIEGIIARAQNKNVPVWAFAGILEKTEAGRQQVRFWGINPPGQSREESMRSAFDNLRSSCQKALEELQELVGA